MKKIIGIFGVVLMVLLAVSCASMSLPAPTPEEAKEYEDTLGEVLASAGFGGVFNVINGDDLDGEYEPGDKLGAFTVTEKSHVRIDIDLSGIFEGKQKVTFDIDVAYENRKGEAKSLVYAAETGAGENGNKTVIKNAALNGKSFDPAAMQAALAD